MKTKHTLAFVVACLINHWNNTGTRPSPELLYSLAKPITFTRSNIETFLKDTFNHPWYGTHCLPANFMHISDLLSYIDRVKNPRDFALSIFNLFHSRLKESQWVNPYALAQIIDVIIKQCEPLCAITKNTTRAAIKKTLYQAMLSRFHELKTDPEFFMTSVADEIITVVERGNKNQPMNCKTSSPDLSKVHSINWYGIPGNRKVVGNHANSLLNSSGPCIMQTLFDTK